MKKAKGDISLTKPVAFLANTSGDTVVKNLRSAVELAVRLYITL
jgi:hypothetical protein